MFLSEWREFSSASCPAGGKETLWQLASRCCWNRARPWHASELACFLVGLRTYQHPGISALHTRSLFVKFDIEDFHENLPRKSRFDSGRTRLLRTLHDGTKYILLLPAKLNRRKSALFEWNVIRLLGTTGRKQTNLYGGHSMDRGKMTLEVFSAV